MNSEPGEPIDPHSERQLVAVGLLICVLIVRILLTLLGLVPWSNLLVVVIVLLPAIVAVWLATLPALEDQ